MLKKDINGKYQCEEFLEEARDWFYNLHHEKDDIILSAYMKEKNIKSEEVDW